MSCKVIRQRLVRRMRHFGTCTIPVHCDAKVTDIRASIAVSRCLSATALYAVFVLFVYLKSIYIKATSSRQWSVRLHKSYVIEIASLQQDVRHATGESAALYSGQL